MGIKKQEFYEGAALHVLARSGAISGLCYDPPFFLFNGSLSAYFKYSTRGRSPWAFTFMPAEQLALAARAAAFEVVIGLVCGADGVAALSYRSYLRVASTRNAAVHIACYRRRGEHYEVNGPDGTLGEKIAPSSWRRILGGLGSR